MKKFIYLLIFIFLTSICAINNTKAYKIEDLENGTLYEEELTIVSQGYDYYPKKIIDFEDLFLVVGYVITDEENSKYPYIAFYENDDLKWYNVNEMFKGGEYVSAVINSKKIILIGKDTKNSFICEYSLNGSILKTKQFIYKNEFKFQEIYLGNNKYFITGDTNSNDFTGGNENNTIAFVIEMNITYEITDKCIFGNKGNNILIDSIEFDDEICLLMKIQGEGFFSYNMNPYMIITCDKRMNLSINESVDLENPDFMRTDKDKIYVFSCDKMNSSVSRISMEKGLNNAKKTIYYSTNKTNIITNYDVKYDFTNGIWGTSVEYSQGEKRTHEYVIRNQKDEIISNFFKNNQKGLNKSIYLIKGFIYNLGLEIKYNNWNINVSKMIYIKLKGSDCFFNGIRGSNDTKELNDDLFGIYDGEIKYKFNDFYVCADGKVYVPLRINITNNSSYNKGLELTFNGQGILNGMTIESGYVINEIGNYVLEINGHNDTKYFHFYVKDMINEENEVKYKRLDFEVKSEEKKINNENEVKNIDNKKVDKKVFIASLVCVAVGFSVSFIKFRRKKCLDL